MTPKLAKQPEPAGDIKRMPDDAEMRRAIRAAAAQEMADRDRSRRLSREELADCGRAILERLELPSAFLGFVMVAVNNAFWLPILETVPFERRLFLLPHCLSDRDACRGTYDAIGLHCAGCGGCEIERLAGEAERLGYSIIVAEGTSSVLFRVLEGDADAIFGVACLDSLDKSFQRVAELGIPHIAVPLLKDGCVDTVAEIDEILSLLPMRAEAAAVALPKSHVGLLRETGRLFQMPQFAELLGPHVESGAQADAAGASVETIAIEWLKEGGKRLRPFVTLAAYAVARHGAAALDAESRVAEMLPLSVRRIALAIEALHKASLVHDDIEDNDDFRYGRPTLHRVYGVAQTINIGDFLIGLGYRLIAGEMESLGAECTGDVLGGLSRAHLELCRGQGEELQYQREPRPLVRSADVMKMAAQKTSPAFEVAIYAGLRAAGTEIDPDVLRRFATYLGEGFQIRNDLDDWQEDRHNKQKRGLDVRAGRPTLLQAFAAESTYGTQLAELNEAMAQGPSETLIDQVYELYQRSGAFAKVERLYEKLRDRALAEAEGFPSADLQELMRFLVRIILQEPTASKAAS